MNGITNDISVSLGSGGPNTFDFEAPAATPGSVSTVLANLNITNQSVETNIINNVVIQGNLNVHTTSNGYKELDMLGTQVNGYTEVNNYTSADGSMPPSGTPTYAGDSFTNITNCTFEGLNVKNTATAAALEIDNGVGFNVVFAQAPARCRPARHLD